MWLSCLISRFYLILPTEFVEKLFSTALLPHAKDTTNKLRKNLVKIQGSNYIDYRQETLKYFKKS